MRRLRIIERLPPHDLPVEERIRIVQELDRENWGIKTGKASATTGPSEGASGLQEEFKGRKTGTTA
jgi:hypothetical protein